MLFDTDLHKDPEFMGKLAEADAEASYWESEDFKNSGTTPTRELFPNGHEYWE